MAKKGFWECFFEAIVDILTYPIRQIRDIACRPAGYLKLIQSLLVIFALGGFGLLMGYTMFYDNNYIDSDVFITVIVGLIGTIVGMFFSESAMGHIEQENLEMRQEVKTKKRHIQELNRLYDEVQSTLEKIKKATEKKGRE